MRTLDQAVKWEGGGRSNGKHLDDVGRPAAGGPGAGAPKAGGLALPGSPQRGWPGRGGGRGDQVQTKAGYRSRRKAETGHGRGGKRS